MTAGDARGVAMVDKKSVLDYTDLSTGHGSTSYWPSHTDVIIILHIISQRHRVQSSPDSVCCIANCRRKIAIGHLIRMCAYSQ